MSENRQPYSTVRVSDQTHTRLKGHMPTGGTVTQTAHHALDALEREQQLPAAVVDGLADHFHRDPPAGDDWMFVKFVDPLHDRLAEHNADDETLSETLARGLDALDRAAYLPAVVGEVCDG